MALLCCADIPLRQAAPFERSTTAEGIARVKKALGLTEEELNADLSKDAKAQLVRESETELKNEF